MQKQSVKQQVAQVMAFVRDKYPEWVSYREVMYNFDVGATKAQELCKTAAEISDCYEYKRGRLHYKCDPETFNSGYETLEEAFKDPESSEDSVPIGVYESRQLFNILKAEPDIPEDKGSLKMPKRSRKRWKANDWTP